MGLQEDFDALKGHHEGVMASLTTLQNKLDAELQRHVDKDATFDAAMKRLRADQAVEIELLKEQHAAELAAQAKTLATQHAAEIAKLKAEVLIPAQRDLHARQLADLQARHTAELETLQ